MQQPRLESTVHISFLEFLARRNLKAPDGRPLHRYEASEEELESFRIFLKTKTIDKTWWGPIFCVYASEYSRRTYNGGHWTWAPILESIDFDYEKIWLYPHIERGLRYLKRQLHRSSDQNAYLLTLVCEGGLPLRVLQNSGATIRRFLGELIARSERYPRETVQSHAEILSAKHLPRALRQDAFLASVIELTEALVALRREFTGVGSIAELDRRQPNWHENVPLPLDDQSARTLLEELIGAPREFEDRNTQLLVDTELRINDDDGIRTLAFDRVLRPLQKIPTSSVRELVGAEHTNDLPSRLQLYLSDGSDDKSVHVATLIQGTDNNYLIQSYAASLPYVDVEAVTPLRITTSSGNLLGSYAVSGASPLSDIPLIFTRPGANSAPRLIATGSYSTREPELLIVAPPNFRPETLDGELIDYGLVTSPERLVFLLRGTATWQVNGRPVRVRTKWQSEDNTYHLLGRLNTGMFIKRPIYLGAPSLAVRDNEGQAHAIIEPRRLEVRHLNSSVFQKIDTTNAFGAVRLRYVDGGDTLFSTSCVIAPTDLKINLIPLARDGYGRIEVTSSHIKSFTVVNDAHYYIESEDHGANRKAIELSLVGHEPHHVGIKIQFKNGGEIEGKVPFPLTLRSFLDRDARPIPHGTELSINALSGIVARHIATQSHKMRTIEVAAHRPGSAYLSSKHEVIGTLSQSDGYGSELHLQAIRERLKIILDSLPEAGASIGLSLLDAGAVPRPNPDILVRRRDAVLECEKNANRGYHLRVKMLDNALVRNRDIQLQAMPSWDPDAEPETLPRADDGDWYFQFDGRAQGTWLITAWSGDVFIAGPRHLGVWPHDSTLAYSSESPSELERIARSYPAKERDFSPVFDEMAQDWFHPDWDRLLSYIDALSTYPPRSFDIITALAQHSDALVLSLFKASNSATPAFLNGMLSLNVMWQLIPLRSWLLAVKAMQKASLIESNECEQSGLVGAEYSARRIFQNKLQVDKKLVKMSEGDSKLISSIIKILPYCFQTPKDEGGLFRMFESAERSEDSVIPILQPVINACYMRAAQATSLPNYQLDIPQRITDKSSRLTRLLLKNINDEYHMTLRAPIIAAAYVVYSNDTKPNDDFITCMRRVRLFDATYFDETQEVAFAYLAADVFKKDNDYFTKLIGF